MMVCMNCYQKNSILLFNKEIVEVESKRHIWSLHQYKCKICNTIHQVCVPREKGETNEKKVTENVENF